MSELCKQLAAYQIVFYWIGIGSTGLFCFIGFGAALTLAMNLIWKRCKDAHSLAALMWAWRIHKDEAKQKADENSGALP